MNDDFLMRYQPTPRPEFAKALASRLRKQMRRQALGRSIGAALAVVVLTLSTLIALPQTRAAVLHFIREVGGMGFIECAWDECVEIDASLRAQEGQGQEMSSASLDLAELRAAYPAIDAFLPTWIPEGFQPYDGQVHISWTGENVTAGIIWATSTWPDTGIPYIGFSVWTHEGPLMAIPGTLEETTVDGHTAVIFEHHAGAAYDEPVLTLNWRQNGLHYSLAWPSDRIPREQVLQMAASFPEDDQLPVPPGLLVDLFSQIPSEQE